MALRLDRDYYCQEDIANVWDGATAATRGGIASIKVATSGVGLVGTKSTVEYADNPSGVRPVGLLVQDVVNVDTSQYPLCPDRCEVTKGDPVTVIRKGWVVTDMILGTPAAGATAYLSWSGNVSATQAPSAPAIGRFETTKDADGFAKLYVDI